MFVNIRVLRLHSTDWKSSLRQFLYIHILVYIFPFCSILIFEDSFVNHLSVKLISSIKIIIIKNPIWPEANKFAIHKAQNLNLGLPRNKSR